MRIREVIAFKIIFKTFGSPQKVQDKICKNN